MWVPSWDFSNPLSKAVLMPYIPTKENLHIHAQTYIWVCTYVTCTTYSSYFKKLENTNRQKIIKDEMKPIQNSSPRKICFVHFILPTHK